MNQILQEDSGDMALLAPFFSRESESRLIKLLKEDFSVFATSVFFPQCFPLVKSSICFPFFLAQVPPFAFFLFLICFMSSLESFTTCSWGREAGGREFGIGILFLLKAHP